MAEDGLFSEDDRIELIRGEIVEMSPIGDPHLVCLIKFLRLLRPVPGIDLSPQNPVRIPALQSEPQPDLVVLRFRDDLEANPPSLADILLLIEVSDSSLAYDRDVKVPLYAEASVPETWLADLKTKTVFAYRRPSPQGYQEVRRFRRGETITPLALPKERFAVDAIFGREP